MFVLFAHLLLDFHSLLPSFTVSCHPVSLGGPHVRHWFPDPGHGLPAPSGRSHPLTGMTRRQLPRIEVRAPDCLP